MLSIFLVLLGVLGSVVGIVMFIASLIKKRKKVMISFSVAIASFVLFITGIATMDMDEPSGNSVAQEKDDKETGKNGDLAPLYTDKVERWKGQVVAEYDTWWNTNWERTMSDLEKNEITLDEGIEKLEELRDTHYSGLIEYIEEYSPPKEFEGKQLDKINEFKNKMIEAVKKRNEGVTEMITILNSSDTPDLEEVESIVNNADDLALEGIASISELEVEIGVREE